MIVWYNGRQKMKHLSLLPEDIAERVKDFTWNCNCGAKDLRVSVTRKGRIQGHCPNCGLTFFWNDPQLIEYEDPFFYEKEEKPIRKKCKNGWWTAWYPKAKVREFYPAK